jgi:quercetin dioxygenase-like cupin family protein
MSIIRSGSIPSIALHGARFTPCASPRSGASELAMWIVEFEPGAAGAPHHVDREELLHVLSGSLTIEVDGEPAELSAGDTLSVPAGALLLLRNANAARVLACARAGLTATLADGSQLQPPWAN